MTNHRNPTYANYSPLNANTLDGLSETAGCLYLKLLDVFQGHTVEGERRAFRAACDYEARFAGVFDYILQNAPIENLNDKVRADLSQFFAERWRHNFMESAA